MKYVAYLSFIVNIGMVYSFLTGSIEVRKDKPLAAAIRKIAPSAVRATPAPTPTLSNGDWMSKSGSVLQEPARPARRGK